MRLSQPTLQQLGDPTGNFFVVSYMKLEFPNVPSLCKCNGGTHAIAASSHLQIYLCVGQRTRADNERSGRRSAPHGFDPLAPAQGLMSMLTASSTAQNRTGIPVAWVRPLRMLKRLLQPVLVHHR